MLMLMKRALVAFSGGVIITALLTVIPLALIVAMDLHRSDYAMLLLLPVVWPMILFSHVVPLPHDVPLFDLQQKALQASIVFDVLFYALLKYCFLSWRAKRRRFA
jgi:prepilin signal peptidase PulO-like enzyme (type II secretory pathway)